MRSVATRAGLVHELATDARITGFGHPTAVACRADDLRARGWECLVVYVRADEFQLVATRAV